MKKRLKKAYQLILRNFVIRYLKRNKLDVVAITGSVGKTSAKEAIYQVLSAKYKVGKTKDSKNDEVGVPATILGLKIERFPFGWMKNILLGFFKSSLVKNKLDKIILEMGADRIGDIKYLTSFIKPNIAVVTRVACAHLEFFCSLENVAQEKGTLVEALDSKGWVILNYDDPNVRKMNDRTKAKVFYFGLDKNSDLYADEIKSGIGGIDFKVHYKKESVNVHLDIIGKHLIYSALAGIACGLVSGMEFKETTKAVAGFQTEKGRLDLVQGVKGSMIINDTYNANPESMKAAIQTLNDLAGKKRKIAVLGDMLELGKESDDFHREIGKELIGSADLFFAVGPQSKYIFEEAEKKMDGKVFWFPDSQSAVESVKENIRSGDMILVKGSRGMRMEMIVKALSDSDT